jgi:hypothetical protein
VHDNINFDHMDLYEEDRVRRFQTTLNESFFKSENCFNMKISDDDENLPKIEIYETVPSVREIYKQCLNADKLSFMSFEAETVDPILKVTYWMRKNHFLWILPVSFD